MRLVVKAATIMGADRLRPISFAHLDACFYTGQAHVDFIRFLLENGASLAVPTWTNNGVVSLADPTLRPSTEDPQTVSGAAELMRLYAQLGCSPTWTCAPYQHAGGPQFGDHIAVGESNAVSYYNSVTGARTNKYGDYLDVACALTGLVPDAGLHRDEHRKATLHVDCTDLPEVLAGNRHLRPSHRPSRRAPVGPPRSGDFRSATNHGQRRAESHQFRRGFLRRRRTLAWRRRHARSTGRRLDLQRQRRPSRHRR